MHDRRQSRVAIGAALALLLVVSACGDDGDSGDSGDSEDSGAASSDLSGTGWILTVVSIDGNEVTAVGTPTLAFGPDGMVAGSTGCNQFAGTYTQDGAALSIELGPVTLAACTDPDATAQEAAILGQLPEVTAYSVQDDELVLTDSDDETLLRYDTGLSTIEGTSWTATGINNGTGGIESSAETGTVTADFGANGELSGFSGCNNYSGTYALSGDGGITVTDIASTRKACDETATTLETRYLAALANATTLTISGEVLTLRDSSGAAQVSYVLAP